MCSRKTRPSIPGEGHRAYGSKRGFGEIAVVRDLTNMPDDVKRRTTTPAQDAEQHRIVLYLACNVFRTSDLIQSILAVFDRLGLDRKISSRMRQSTTAETRRRRKVRSSMPFDDPRHRARRKPHR